MGERVYAVRAEAAKKAAAVSKFFFYEPKRQDREWFRKAKRGFPQEMLWNPAQLIVDVSNAQCADMIYNSHKSTLFGALVFAFTVACVLLWIVGEGLWGNERGPRYAVTMLPGEDFPERMKTTVPYNITLRVVDENTRDADPIGIPGAKVAWRAFPAERFPLDLHHFPERGREGKSIRIREVDCLRHLGGDDGYWAFQDKVLCDIPLSHTSGVTNSSGYARFPNLRIRGGPDTLISIVARVDVPGHPEPVYKQTYVRHDTAVYGWAFLGAEAAAGKEMNLEGVGDGDVLITYKLAMLYPEQPPQEEMSARMAALWCPPVVAGVDGRQLLVPELQPMPDPTRHTYAAPELVGTTLLETYTHGGGEERSEGHELGSTLYLWEQLYTARVRMRWCIGKRVYAAIFVGPGLMNAGDALVPPKAVPAAVIGAIPCVVPAPRPTLRMTTLLPATIMEGKRLTVRVAVDGMGGSKGMRPAVVARVVAFERDGVVGALPEYWRDASSHEPAEGPTTFKDLQGALAEAKQDPATKEWTVTLSLAFTTHGLVGRYGVVFEWGDAVRLQPLLRNADSGGSTVWSVHVLTSVCSALSSFKIAYDLVGSALEESWHWIGAEEDHLRFSPSFKVLSCNDEFVAGKAVRVVPRNASEFGISARSQESNGLGQLAFTEFFYTFAARDGAHTMDFYVDDVHVMDMTVSVKVAETYSRLRPAHVHVCKDPSCEVLASSSSIVTAYQPFAEVLVVNARGDPVPGVAAWGRVAYADRRVPPVGFTPDVDPGTLGSRQSRRVLTNARGVARVPMAHVGGPCLVPLTFTAERIAQERMYPSGVGGLVMLWPPRNGGAQASVITKRTGTRPGEMLIDASNADVPIKLVAIQYPLRWKLLGHGQPMAPAVDTAHNVTLVLDGLAAPGTYLFSVFADGRWRDEVGWEYIDAPVAALEVVQASAVALDPANATYTTLDGNEVETMRSDGTPFALQPAVRCLDAEGRPVAGAVVMAYFYPSSAWEGERPLGDSALNPLYFRNALSNGALLEVAGLRMTTVTMEDITAGLGAIKDIIMADAGDYADLAEELHTKLDALGALDITVGDLSSVTTASGLLALLQAKLADFPLHNAVSAPSDDDGIARFRSLGAVNPSVASPSQVVYCYVQDAEVGWGAAGVVVAEGVWRVGDRRYSGHLLGTVQPVVTPNAAFHTPPVVMLDEETGMVLPFVVGAAEVQQGSLEARLTSFTNHEPAALIYGIGSVKLPTLTFLPASDMGKYILSYVLPGTEAIETSVFYLNRSPHMIELLPAAAPPLALGGSVVVFRVRAKLADGSPVYGATITAMTKLTDEKGNEICAKCEFPKYQARTDANGVAVFHLATEGVITGYYQLTVEASRGLADYVNAQAAITGVKDLLQRAAYDAEENVHIEAGTADALLAPFLDGMFQDGAKFVDEFVFDKALTELSTVSATADPLLIFSGVVRVNITTQPVKKTETALPLGPRGVRRYNCTFSPMAALVVETVAGLRAGLGVTDLVVMTVKKDELVSTQYYDYYQGAVTDSAGRLIVDDLWIAAPPGTYIILFNVRGVLAESASFTITGKEHKKHNPSVYERAAVILIILLPWLFANVPYVSVYWVLLSFGLAAALPWWIDDEMPKVFRSEVVYLRVSLGVAAVLWLVIIVALLVETVRLISRSVSPATQQIINDYRYARWLAKMIPFSKEEDLERSEYHRAVAERSFVYGWLLSLYLWYVGDKLDDPEFPVALPAGRHNPTWTVTGLGAVTLHRDPRLYHQLDDALLSTYGASYGSTTDRAVVSVRVAGVGPEELALFAADIEHDLHDLLDVSVHRVRVAPSRVGLTYADVVFEIAEPSDCAGDRMRRRVHDRLVDADLVTASAPEHGIGTATIDVVNSFTPSAVRCDNDAEWTWRDTLLVKWHYMCVPLMVEEERVVDMADDPDREPIEGMQRCVRIWIRHRLPNGLRRSNGEPFPDFWSPDADGTASRALQENPMAKEKPFIPLDTMKPEAGGRPQDIESPVRLPFRFCVAIGIFLVIVTFIALFAFYYVEQLRDVLRRISLTIPNPAADGPMTQNERDTLNSQLQFYITWILNKISVTHPLLGSSKAWVPMISEFDFAEEWHRLYRIARNTLHSVEAAALMAAIAAPILSLSGWIFLLMLTPGYIARLRRNAPDEPEVRAMASCATADYYVGLQALGGAVNYVVIFGVFFLLGLVLFNDSVLPVATRALKTLIISAIIASIIQQLITLSTQFIWAPGASVAYPRVYSKVTVVSAVISLVGGAAQTVARLIKSIAAQLLLFPRLDIRSIPGAFGRLDTGYWSYWSMLYVDEMHNNPILRTFCGVIITDTLIKTASRTADPPARTARHDAEPGAVQALVRIVARERRGGATSSEPCAIGGLRVFVDCEPLSASGRPFIRHGRQGSHRDLRYFRSPHPPGPTQHGCGCFRCGAPPDDLPSFYSLPQEHLKYLRVVVRGATGGWDDWLGRMCVHAVRKADREPPVLSMTCVNGALCVSLQAPILPDELRAVEVLPPGDADGSDAEVDSGNASSSETLQDGAAWALLGSTDGRLWALLHEAPAAEPGGLVVPDMLSTLVLCERCHAARRPEEGAPRVLVPVPCTVLGAEDTEHGGFTAALGSSFLASVTLPSLECRVRAYSLQTSRADAVHDLTGWIFAVAYASEDTYTQEPDAVAWEVRHEVTAAPIPPTRGLYTNRYGVWPAPAAPLDYRREALQMLKYQHPFVKELVRVRLLHVLGVEGAALQERRKWVLEEARGGTVFEKPKEGEDEGKESDLPTACQAPYASLLERSAWRAARCGQSRWALCFILTMNPSLLAERKTLDRRQLTHDELRHNTAELRGRVAGTVWRRTEAPADTAAATAPTMRSTLDTPLRVCRPATDTITLTCDGAAGAFFSGVYVREEERRAVRVRVGGEAGRVVLAAPEPVGRVTAVHGGGVDFTDAVAQHVHGGVLRVELAAEGGEGVGVVDVSSALASHERKVGEEEEEEEKEEEEEAENVVASRPALAVLPPAVWIDVFYTTVVYVRRETRPCQMAGIRTAVTTWCDAALQYQDGAWRVAPRVPAGGYAYPSLVSEPRGAGDPPASVQQWAMHDPATKEWESVDVAAVCDRVSLSDVSLSITQAAGDGPQGDDLSELLATPMSNPLKPTSRPSPEGAAEQMRELADVIYEASQGDFDGLLLVLVDHTRADDAEAVVALFEQATGDINSFKGITRRTALLEAARYGNEPLVAALVARGADVSHADASGATPMIEASRSGHTRVAAALLQCGAGVDVRDSDGWAPLHHAAVQGHRALVLLLVAHGADATLLCHAGRLPSDLAAQHGHEDIVHLLTAAMKQHGQEADRAELLPGTPPPSDE